MNDPMAYSRNKTDIAKNPDDMHCYTRKIGRRVGTIVASPFWRTLAKYS